MWVHRYIVSRAAPRRHSQIEIEGVPVGPDRPHAVGFADVSVAFFHARPEKPSWAYPLPEMRKEGKCWIVKGTFYGTRMASTEFQEYVAQSLLSSESMRRYPAIPVVYHFKAVFLEEKNVLEVVAVRHGDDFIYEGDDISLDSFDQILVTYFKIRIGRRVGPLPHHAKRGVHLNRIIECNDEGYTWQADPKHVENLLEVLNMKGCSPAVTPGTKDTGKNERHAEKELIGEARQAMCSAAGICQYLSADRKDIQFSAKEVMRHISKPCLLGLLKLKRLARFLKGHKTLVYVYKFQDKPESVDVVVDANYADEASHSRKSTSSGDIFMGGHLLIPTVSHKTSRH